MHRFLLLALAAIVSGCAVTVDPEPPRTASVQATLNEWAQARGYQVQWMIPDFLASDATLKQFVDSSKGVRPGLDDLLVALDTHLRTEAAARREAYVPIEACVFTDVIRIQYKSALALPCSGL